MEIRLICLGKTSEKHVEQGVEMYVKRLKHYVKFSVLYLSHPKLKGNLNWDDIKAAEAEIFFSELGNEPFILLDEKGQEFTSIAFAKFLQSQFNKGGKRLNFLIGGAFGFSKEIHQKSKGQIALSQLTFSHQLVRLIAMEQFYRAMTIIKGEKYHHK
ncbi:MAG: 23S rRNA (pseudouridine(1915)-N(3))-methyltransferase RlmH [Bacteroidota bacterium]